MYLDVKEIIEYEFGDGQFKNYCGKDYYYFIKLSDMLEDKIPKSLMKEYEDTICAFITYQTLMYEHFQKYFFTALESIFSPHV